MAQAVQLLPETPNIEAYKDVWAVVEVVNGELVKYSLEAIGAGRRVADKVGMRVGAVVMGYGVGEEIFNTVIQHGADYVVYIEHEALRDYNPLAYSKALAEASMQYRPWALLLMSDEMGRDMGPRVAYMLKTGMAADLIDLDVENFYFGLLRKEYKNILAQIRPDFATRIAKIYTPRHRPQVATLRPGNFPIPPRNPSRRGEVVRFRPNLSQEDYGGFRVLKVERVEDPGQALNEADLIVSLGLGVLRDAKGNAVNPIRAVEEAERLMKLVGDSLGVKTALGASRALILADVKELRGIITKYHQIGQTGRTVAPKVYIAVGISGAIQHRVGVKAKNVVAINIDPNAPIREISNYIIEEDLYEALPKLYQALERKLSELKASKNQ